MKLIAFDQSTTASGWCVMEMGTCEIIEYGVIKPVGETNERISYTVKRALALCRIHEPTFVFIEGVQYQKNTKVLEILAKLAGVLEIMLIEQGYFVNIVKASEWRRRVGISNGKRAKMKQTARDLVKEKYDLEPTEDECEAILFALAFATEETRKVEGE